MRVRHTVATALAGILLIQSAGLAQARDPAVRPIARKQALQILLSTLPSGTEVRVQLARGAQVDGQFVEKCGDEVAVLVSGQRRLILVADVISISRPLRREASASGRSLAMGAAIGAGLLFVAILVARAAAR